MPFSGGGVTEVCVLFLLPSVRQGGALALGLCHYRKKLHQFKIMRVKMQNRFLVFFFFLSSFLLLSVWRNPTPCGDVVHVGGAVLTICQKGQKSCVGWFWRQKVPSCNLSRGSVDLRWSWRCVWSVEQWWLDRGGLGVSAHAACRHWLGSYFKAKRSWKFTGSRLPPRLLITDHHNSGWKRASPCRLWGKKISLWLYGRLITNELMLTYVVIACCTIPAARRWRFLEIFI